MIYLSLLQHLCKEFHYLKLWARLIARDGRQRLEYLLKNQEFTANSRNPRDFGYESICRK
jgi:hypothetical protein